MPNPASRLRYHRRRVVTARIALALALAATVAACASTGGLARPFAATHRGDPTLPENTLPAFRSAIEAGAEYLETDIVSTRDGVLVLRHDRHLSATTDVENRPEFADRRVTKIVRGREATDWWVEDFTLAELATLRATARNRSPSADHRVATVSDLIELARDETRTHGRRIGLYLETKQPKAFEELGHDLENMLADALVDAGLNRGDGSVYVQSWEPESVREMDGLLRVRTVQLISAAPYWDDKVTSPGLATLREQGVDGINVEDERLETDDALIGRARSAGLFVHAWGFEAGEDYDAWIGAGIDGLVTDDVSAVLAARSR